MANIVGSWRCANSLELEVVSLHQFRINMVYLTLFSGQSIATRYSCGDSNTWRKWIQSEDVLLRQCLDFQSTHQIICGVWKRGPCLLRKYKHCLNKTSSVKNALWVHVKKIVLIGRQIAQKDDKVGNGKKCLLLWGMEWFGWENVFYMGEWK